MTRILIFILVFSLHFLHEGTKTGYPPKFEAYTEPLSGTDLGIRMQPVPGSKEQGIDSFWMSAFEITWDLYDHFLLREIDDVPALEMGKDVKMDIDAVSGATTPYVDMSNGMGKGANPVVNVTQYAASTFCKWLSAKTGKFYRLPTESEWEYACQAGTKSKYSFGNRKKDLDAFAWYADNSGGKSHPAGQKAPNALGLYDMHGNVAEWVTRDDINTTDQAGMSLYPRKLKGGSWKDEADDLAITASMASDKQWKMQDPQIPKSLWWFTGAPFAGFRIVRPMHVPVDYGNWWIQPIKEFD